MASYDKRIGKLRLPYEIFLPFSNMTGQKTAKQIAVTYQLKFEIQK